MGGEFIAAEVCGQCHGISLMGDKRDGYLPGMDIHQLRTYMRPRYIQTGYRTRKINDAYFTIVETDRFRGLALIESVLLMLGRIIELEDQGNAKGALFLLRERQETLHLPNPALLPRAVLYWTAGEAVRRILDPGHEHVGKSSPVDVR